MLAVANYAVNHASQGKTVGALKEQTCEVETCNRRPTCLGRRGANETFCRKKMVVAGGKRQQCPG